MRPAIIQSPQPITFWRDARMTDVTCRFVENANMIFEPITPLNPAHHSELGSIGRPIGLLPIFERVAHRAAINRHAS